MVTAGVAIALAEMVEDAITAEAVSQLVVDTREADRKHAAVVPIVAERVPVRVTRQPKGVARDQRIAAAARPVAAMADLALVVAKPVAAVALMAVVAVARPMLLSLTGAEAANTGKYWVLNRRRGLRAPPFCISVKRPDDFQSIFLRRKGSDETRVERSPVLVIRGLPGAWRAGFSPSPR
jgi:hypothetical protein